MIARIRGIVVEKSLQSLIVEVHGVGYTISVSDDRLFQTGQEVSLHIYSHWNQEQGPHLYGFADSLAKSVFQHILSCTGCGPKIGLAVLSAMAPHQFIQIIATSDTRALSQVSGIGPKKAELMIMQLKDKISKIPLGDIHPAQHAELHMIKQVSAALAALHYKPSEITHALDFITQNAMLDASSFDDLLKRALSVLAKRV